MGYTQDALAKLAGIAPAQISRYESGMNKPRANIIAKLADVLSVPYAWLAHGDESNFSINTPKEKGEMDMWVSFPTELYDVIKAESGKTGRSIEETVIDALYAYAKHKQDSEKNN